MRSLARYLVIAFAVIAVAILVISPFATSFVDQWAQRDIELRGELVFNSIKDELTTLLARGDATPIESLFDRLAQDERLLAVGFCDGAATLRYRSKSMPSEFSCVKIARTRTESAFTTVSVGRRLIVASFPVSGAISGHLVLVHDLTFAEHRTTEAQVWIAGALAGIALVAAALASLIALLVMRGWFDSLRGAIDEMRTGRPRKSEAADGVFGAKVRELLRTLDETRRSLDASHADWNADTLRLIVDAQLKGTEIIVVSNREPYIHNRGDNGVTLQIPASGLVAAIEPVMQACGGTWIAHGSGSADRQTVDSKDRIRVPPTAPAYMLRRIWLSEEEQDGYYYGLANEGLWPLCHIAFVRPVFRESDWQRYRAVNARFAQAVFEEAKRPDPIILVQDYHLALVPRMIRERLPRATVITFWHIPWPNSEAFGICPWKEEIIAGLLGSTVLGFHTQFHCNNFIETVDRFMESRIDRERASIIIGGHETFVRPYPISIAWPLAALAAQKSVPECRIAVRRRLGLHYDVRLAVGIERFDYTKGILDRMRAIDRLLGKYGQWKRRLVFVQIAAPTRSKLATYVDLQKESRALAEEINARHGDENYKPIILVIQHYEPDQICELFRAADLCIVSSLHDGMNLVAKEFVAARDDEQGVLILSSFAGASRELSEALIVNPYDTLAISEAIHRALHMPDVEQRTRMHVMREIVRVRNVYRWAGQMLLDAAQLRKREEIMTMATQEPGPANNRDLQPTARLIFRR